MTTTRSFSPDEQRSALVFVVDTSGLTDQQTESLALNINVQAEAYWEPDAPVSYPDCEVIGLVKLPFVVDSQQVADLVNLWAP